MLIVERSDLLFPKSENWPQAEFSKDVLWKETIEMCHSVWASNETFWKCSFKLHVFSIQMSVVCADVLTLEFHGNASMAANLLNDNIEIWILLWKDNMIKEMKLVRTLSCPVTQEWAHPWFDERSWHWCHPLIHNRADNDKPKPLTMMVDCQHVCGWRSTFPSLSSGSKPCGLFSWASGTSPENHSRKRCQSHVGTHLNSWGLFMTESFCIVCLTD